MLHIIWITAFVFAALHMEGLTPAEIDTVVGTHGHSDHIGNLNLFPHATVIVSYDISRGDTFISNHLGQVCMQGVPRAKSRHLGRTIFAYLKVHTGP